MGPILASLLKLQGIEHDLAHVRRRLRSKTNAVKAVQTQVDELLAKKAQLRDQLMRAQSDTDQQELDRAAREEEIVHLRTVLNQAKTNKEYSALLTQINTFKADNAKLEEDILKIMESLDTIKAEIESVDATAASEQERLTKVQNTNASEVTKLEGLIAELQIKRDDAASHVDPTVLKAFERMANAKDGEAMARIEVLDAKRGEFNCGVCYMTLSAEHFSALLSRDEIRHCGSCGCILYVDTEDGV